MIMLDDYPALKRKVDRLKDQSQQAKGAIAQALARLKQEYGVESVEEAKELIAKLRRKELLLAKKYTKAKTRFEKKWAKQLKELDDA